jgi:hypothetical protein
VRCGRLPVVAIILYVVLDVSNPFMPGIFDFELASSLDGLCQERRGPATPPAMSAEPIAVPTAELLRAAPPAPEPAARPIRVLVRRLPEAHARSGSLDAPSGGADDH